MNILNMQPRDTTSVIGVGDFDFQGKNPVLLGELSVGIRTYLDVHGKYVLAIMNHKEKKYYLGTSGELRTYLYNLTRFIVDGKGIGVSAVLQSIYSRTHKDSWSVEVVKYTPSVRDAIAQKLEGWQEVSGRRAVRSEKLSVVKAVHMPTGWTRYYSIETSEAANVSTHRWTQLLESASTSIPRVSALVRKQSMRDPYYLTRKNYITRLVTESIRARADFSFEVVMSVENTVDASKIGKEVRDLNLLAATAWVMGEVINKVYADLFGKDPLPKRPCIFSQDKYPTPAVIPVGAPKEEPTEPPSLAPVAIEQPPMEVQEQEESIVRYDLPAVVAIEELYRTKRDERHRKMATTIALRLTMEGISVDNFAEVAVDLINRSDMLVLALGGAVDERMIKNAVINGLVPNPECDFKFFEVLSAVCEAVVDQVS